MSPKCLCSFSFPAKVFAPIFCSHICDCNIFSNSTHIWRCIPFCICHRTWVRGYRGIWYDQVTQHLILPITSVFILVWNYVDVHGVGLDPRWNGFQQDGPQTVYVHSEAGRIASALFSMCYCIIYLKWLCAMSGIRSCITAAYSQ